MLLQNNEGGHGLDLCQNSVAFMLLTTVAPVEHMVVTITLSSDFAAKGMITSTNQVKMMFHLSENQSWKEMRAQKGSEFLTNQL